MVWLLSFRGKFFPPQQGSFVYTGTHAMSYCHKEYSFFNHRTYQSGKGTHTLSQQLLKAALRTSCTLSAATHVFSTSGNKSIQLPRDDHVIFRNIGQHHLFHVGKLHIIIDTKPTHVYIHPIHKSLQLKCIHRVYTHSRVKYIQRRRELRKTWHYLRQAGNRT